MSKLFEPVITTIQEESGYRINTAARVPSNYAFDQFGMAATITEDFNPQAAGIDLDLVFAMSNTTLGESDSDESQILVDSIFIEANRGDMLRVNTWVGNEPTIAKRKKDFGDKEVK